MILVDDGSSDDTWQVMHDSTSRLPWVERLRHDQNCGITTTIMTGMRAASTEYVATLDSDCTYDPLQMRQLLDAVEDRVAMVTASPYHPEGAVLGVPGWRLLLSKTASTVYSNIINVPLHTYTSCFRIYLRSAFVDLEVRNQGFVGMTELLWIAVSAGGTVKETPAILTSRRVGYSKLRISTGNCWSSSLDRPNHLPTSLSQTLISTTMNIQEQLRITLPSDQDHTGRSLGQEEIAAVSQAILTGTLTSTKGDFTKQFEQGFAKRVDSLHAIACSSGSAALHTAVAAINPEPGEESSPRRSLTWVLCQQF